MPIAKRKPLPNLSNWIDSGFVAELLESNFQRYAHNAVYVNSRSHREFMRREVLELLASGDPLPLGARAWLVYVLGHCDETPLTRKVIPLLYSSDPLPLGARAWLYRKLANLKDLPHKCRGRPLVDRSAFKNALLEFIIKTGAPIPRGQVVKRLEDASDELTASYDKEASYAKIKRIYYSKSFQSRLSTPFSKAWNLSDFLAWSDDYSVPRKRNIK